MMNRRIGTLTFQIAHPDDQKTRYQMRQTFPLAEFRGRCPGATCGHRQDVAARVSTKHHETYAATVTPII